MIPLTRWNPSLAPTRMQMRARNGKKLRPRHHLAIFAAMLSLFIIGEIEHSREFCTKCVIWLIDAAFSFNSTELREKVSVFCRGVPTHFQQPITHFQQHLNYSRAQHVAPHVPLNHSACKSHFSTRTNWMFIEDLELINSSEEVEFEVSTRSKKERTEAEREGDAVNMECFWLITILCVSVNFFTSTFGRLVSSIIHQGADRASLRIRR